VFFATDLCVIYADYMSLLLTVLCTPYKVLLPCKCVAAVKFVGTIIRHVPFLRFSVISVEIDVEVQHEFGKFLG
jgi:hypothetical protein